MNQEAETYVLREIQLLQMISSPYVVRLDYVSHSAQKYFLGMEYCNAGTLSDFIKARGKLLEFEAQVVMLQLSKGLNDMH